jgi:exonuclease III
MIQLKIISMNCRGLADFKKRKDVFMYLRKFNADIICLQDIHVAEGRQNSFKNSWGQHSIIATGTANSRGVAILTGRNRAITITEVEAILLGT